MPNQVAGLVNFCSLIFRVLGLQDLGTFHFAFFGFHSTDVGFLFGTDLQQGFGFPSLVRGEFSFR